VAPSASGANANANVNVNANANATRPSLVILAAGDVEMGRAMGKRLLREPTYEPFTTIAPLLASADVRFANLEGPISDQHGETMSPNNMLIFNGPPAGADALARARFTIVSTANNHAWDYGKSAMLETLAHLDRVGVLHAGTGASREAAHKAAIVEHGGARVAFLAVTDVWNQGPLDKHEAIDFVARADASELASAVAELRKDTTLDGVVVSYHGGDEYMDLPTARTRAIAHAAIDAGADAFIGHHPHVVQGVEAYRGRLVFYSLGNLLMQMHRDYAWTEFGMLMRLTLRRGDRPRAEVCPFRILGLVPLPLAGPQAAPKASASWAQPAPKASASGAVPRKPLEALFFGHLRDISANLGGASERVRFGATGADGCAPVTEGVP
jgi:poly-gamma-glutamate synthesis protein (capsule biosynthesis protein)